MTWTCVAQTTAEFSVATIAFYNIENLFDTINSVDITNKNKAPTDPDYRIAFPVYVAPPNQNNTSQYDTHDDEYTPNGKNLWNTKKYVQKVSRIAEAISQIGKKVSNRAPAIVGLAEVENRGVLEDLIKDSLLAKFDYQIVHFNSPDERGIDVAMLYQKKRFVLLNAQPIELYIEREDKKRDYTRDQLVVKGLLDGELIHFIVNHWPSRSGGQKRSEPLRLQAAKICRATVDNIVQENTNAKIIIMGDFNDDPNNKSIQNVLLAMGRKDLVRDDKKKLFNPFFKLFNDGVGTLGYRDNWNLFDQILVSASWLDKDNSTYRFWKAGVFNKKSLLQKRGSFKNYPWRSFGFGKYLGGYSDHLPVYVYLIREP